MKTAFRSALSSAVDWTQCLLGHKDIGTRILTYHWINDTVGDYLSVPPAHFRSQMEFLREAGYEVISLRDLLEKGARSKTVGLTFDDGYRDNYENAFPILKEFGFTATVFCIAGRIGTDPYLNFTDIQEMHKAGIDFGSHTLSHPHLPKLDSEEKLKEIMNSRLELEEKTGIVPDFFCYPYGEYDSESTFLVEESGYLGACTNDPGSNDGLEPYTLKRTEISGFDSAEDFQKKMSGAYDLLHKGLHWLRKRP